MDVIGRTETDRVNSPSSTKPTCRPPTPAISVVQPLLSLCLVPSHRNRKQSCLWTITVDQLEVLGIRRAFALKVFACVQKYLAIFVKYCYAEKYFFHLIKRIKVSALFIDVLHSASSDI